MSDLILLVLTTFIITLFSMVLHELAHGLVALWQGDQTARLSGRLTLNPLKHIDPVLTILVPIILAITGMPIFGGAKPVPVNSRNLKHGEWSMALVALAGPLTNFVLAFLFFLGWYWTDLDFCATGVSVNLGFMLFNILPIPPLDGSRVLYAFAPDFVRNIMTGIERCGTTVVFVLVVVFGGLLDGYMSGAVNAIIALFLRIVGAS